MVCMKYHSTSNVKYKATVKASGNIYQVFLEHSAFIDK